MTSEHFDVVVVGGGQAGLAVGFHMARRNINFVILDAYPRVGEAWRKRWESLRLFTPARLDGLPGAPFPDRAGALPTKDEMANYLETYASHHKLPIRLGIRVDALSREEAPFVLHAGNRRFEANQVAMATPLGRLRYCFLGCGGLRGVPCVAGGGGGKPCRDDGPQLDVRNGVWCKAFKHDYTWIKLPAAAGGDIPAHERGVVPAEPGL